MDTTTDLHLSRHGDRLLAAIGDDEPKAVRCLWLQPLTGRGRAVSVMGLDKKEVALIENLDALPTDQQALIEQDLVARYGAPRIQRVRKAWCMDGNRYLDVETDVGGRTFLVRSPEKSFTWHEDGSAIIKDSAGTRYLLPVPASLDEASQKCLDAVL